MYNKQGKKTERSKLLRQRQQDHCWQYNPERQNLRLDRQNDVLNVQTSISASRSAADLGARSALRAPPLPLIRRARPPTLNDIDRINTHNTPPQWS
jgi:hypothetical protein